MSSNKDTIVEDAGSFRDPSGRVVYAEGGVWRLVDSKTLGLMRRLEASGLLRDLADEGLIVGTRIVEPSDPWHGRLLARYPGAQGVLRHDRIPFISYPYEWSPAMLAAAASSTLRLQGRLLEHGLSLKDASAYNIQFQNARPVLIDIPSIAEADRLDIWPAYGQFCRMFLFPLMLYQHRKADYRGFFLTDLDGVSVETAGRMLGSLQIWRPSLWIDVSLQNLLQKQGEKAGTPVSGKPPSGSVGNPAVQQMNLNRLAGIIRRLSNEPRRRSAWSHYMATRSYDAAEGAVKAEFIGRFLKTHRPRRVLDLGCNTGEYSLMAAESGAGVVALDLDADCVDALYRKATADKRSVLPLWMRVDNPSPAIGFRNLERKSFLERVRSDGVFALALIHHLLVTSRIPLDAIAGMLCSLTVDWCVVEYVAREDPMFQRLLAWREDLYGTYSEPAFEAAFNRYFELVEKQSIIDGRRTLYLYRRKK